MNTIVSTSLGKVKALFTHLFLHDSTIVTPCTLSYLFPPSPAFKFCCPPTHGQPQQRAYSITPILRSLDWLSVCYRIYYKILFFVYKALNNLATRYFTDVLTTHYTDRPLRSQDGLLLQIPQSRLKRKGDRAFVVAGPKLWNSLPLPVGTALTLAHFKSKLKSHFFSCAFNSLYRMKCFICFIYFLSTLVQPFGQPMFN